MLPVTVYLALGSNLGDRISNIKNSIEYLKAIPRIKVGKMSGILETLPEGSFKNQSNYLNAVLQIKTTVPPLELLDILKNIEKKLKRKKTVRWGPRTIDLDILFYDKLIFSHKHLVIPHPLLHKRLFVLKPLSEIAPEFTHPLYQKKIKYLLDKVVEEL